MPKDPCATWYTSNGVRDNGNAREQLPDRGSDVLVARAEVHQHPAEHKDRPDAHQNQSAGLRLRTQGKVRDQRSQHDQNLQPREQSAPAGRISAPLEQHERNDPHRRPDAGQMPQQRQCGEQGSGANQPGWMTGPKGRQPPRQNDSKREAVPVGRRAHEVHDPERIAGHGRDRREQHVAAAQQQKDKHGLEKSGRDHRIAEADQIDPEDPKRRRMDEMEQARMDILNVAVQHLAGQQPLSNVRVKSVVGGIPVAVVEVPEQQCIRQAGGDEQSVRATSTLSGPAAAPHHCLFTGAAASQATRTRGSAQQSFRPTPRKDT